MEDDWMNEYSHWWVWICSGNSLSLQKRVQAREKKNKLQKQSLACEVSLWSAFFSTLLVTGLKASKNTDKQMDIIHDGRVFRQSVHAHIWHCTMHTHKTLGRVKPPLHTYTVGWGGGWPFPHESHSSPYVSQGNPVGSWERAPAVLSRPVLLPFLLFYWNAVLF